MWRIWGSDPYNFTDVAWNASSSTVDGAVERALTNIRVDVSRTAIRLGARKGWQWRVTYPWGVGNTVPALNLAIVGAGGAGGRLHCCPAHGRQRQCMAALLAPREPRVC